MDDCRSDQFRKRRLGQDKPPVEFASAERGVEAPERSRNHPHPHAFKIANETIIAKSIIYLDETKCLFNTAQDRLGLPVKGYPNPHSINLSATS
jgi:hypothetical protein